ncbi:MAG TPA: histidine kinase [Kofleriaceae bacterium]
MRYPFILQALGWTLVGGLDFALGRATQTETAVVWSAYASVVLGVLGFAISSALFFAYRRWLPMRGARAVGGAVAGALVGSAIWYVLVNALDRAVGYPDYESLAAGLFGRGMLFFFIMLTWHAALLALRASERAARAERLAQEARLDALRYQLNPHFLFNALNSAVTLIDEDPPRAQKMLELLSSLLRRTLYEDTSAETTLERELDLIGRYLEIQGVRFEDKLRVAIDVPAAAGRCAMPPLLLHALVENAVKHGMQTSTQMPVEVQLTATYDGDALRIEVSNTGHLNGTDRGVGLRSVAARLDALYPGRHSFSIAERGGAVRATMEIRSPRVLE